MDSKIVLITGASRGIGRACAEYLSGKGLTVCGTYRTGVPEKETAYDMYHMDVADLSSVESAVNEILDKYGRIDVLINNAGMGMAGSLEDSSVAEVSAQFDVNLFGAVRVIHTVLPEMRKKGKGQIINIGSMAGLIAIPFQTAYSASKAALFSMTCALRNEIAPFGIKASIVQPGDLKTDFTFNREYTKGSEEGSVYMERCEKSIAKMAADEQGGGDPICVAKAVYRIMKRRNPPVSVVVGFQYKVLAFLARILPARLRLYVVSKMYA